MSKRYKRENTTIALEFDRDPKMRICHRHDISKRILRRFLLPTRLHSPAFIVHAEADATRKADRLSFMVNVNRLLSSMAGDLELEVHGIDGPGHH